MAETKQSLDRPTEHPMKRVCLECDREFMGSVFHGLCAPCKQAADERLGRDFPKGPKFRKDIPNG